MNIKHLKHSLLYLTDWFYPCKLITRVYLSKNSSHNLQVDSLDGLRGVAVLFVLFSYICNTGLTIPPFLNFSGSGKYGVFLFFTLSAYLLTTPLLKNNYNLLNRRLWLNYFIRRTLRIYPLFFIVLLANILIFSVLKQEIAIRLSWRDVLNHLMLQDGKSIFWSIPVEFKYYFV